jgi:hypothetical protein
MVQRYIKNYGKYVYHQDYENQVDKHRVITYLWYLNTIEEGGETEFYGNYKIKPEQGKLIFFPAFWCYPHCGNIPLSDNKYIITGWMYEMKSTPQLNIQDKFVQRYFDNTFLNEMDCQWLMVEIDKYFKEINIQSSSISFESIQCPFNFMTIKIKNLICKLKEFYSLSDNFGLNTKNIYFVKNENIKMLLDDSSGKILSIQEEESVNSQYQHNDSKLNSENMYLFKFYIPLFGNIDFYMNDTTTKKVLPCNLFLFSEKNVKCLINSTYYIYGFFENN